MGLLRLLSGIGSIKGRIIEFLNFENFFWGEL